MLEVASGGSLEVLDVWLMVIIFVELASSDTVTEQTFSKARHLTPTRLKGGQLEVGVQCHSNPLLSEEL